MTNKMRLTLIIAASVCAVFSVLTTPFAVNVADQLLSGLASALDLHETPVLSALAVLVIPGLYFVFRQRRHS